MSDRNEALRLADAIASNLALGEYTTMTQEQQVVEALRRLTAEQAVMRQWIAEAVRELDLFNKVDQWPEIVALIESGRRLVDGGPDDLLAGVE